MDQPQKPLPDSADGLDDETFERVSEEQREQPAVDGEDAPPPDAEPGKD